MRKILTLLTLPILALTLWPAAPATAAAWCLYDPRGGSNCGFYSFEQCMEGQSGVGGSCQRNPDYRRGPPRDEVVVEADEPVRRAGRWCLVDSREGTHCGFATLAHCRRNQDVIGGSCERN
jgi:hypothetical protein